MSEIAWRFAPAIIDEALDKALPEPEHDDERAVLRRAMRYAVMGGGKRLRSRLVLEAAGVVGGDGFIVGRALPAACALEMIHAYSLVHDDLPAMDNADTRRGRPSCHKAFGEAIAILAGDALLTLAFEMLVKRHYDEERHGGEWTGTQARSTLRAVQLIAEAAGEAGMAGGQAIDIAWSSNDGSSMQAAVTGDALAEMHAMKTGALIRVAAEAGALLGGGAAAQIEALRDYGAHLGRAFQITDDVLDVVGDPEHMGKAATDAANGKATAPAVFGLERSKQLAAAASEAAIAALQDFGAEADALRHLAEFVVKREN